VGIRLHLADASSLDQGWKDRPVTLVGKMMKPLFEVSPTDMSAPPVEDDVTTLRLHQVVRTVTDCCHIALFNNRFEVLVPKLDAYDEELRGFAYEGAGVGLAALDSFLPWKQRTRDFVAGPGARYVYAIYLGAGMSLARMRRNPEPFRARLGDPVFGWVVLDGYGFHQGFFAQRRYVAARAVPRLVGYASRAFDHGLGRSIWFSTRGNVARVAETIDAFPIERHRDLWSGVGLACGYAGGVARPIIETLRVVAGSHRSDLAVGAAIAAKLRHQVGNPAEHNETACAVLCGLTSKESAHLADTALRDLPADGVEPAYEVWRQRIRAQFE
jgi:hypothetical protein